jgi:hypothetical protein
LIVSATDEAIVIPMAIGSLALDMTVLYFAFPALPQSQLLGTSACNHIQVGIRVATRDTFVTEFFDIKNVVAVRVGYIDASR